jgi:DNA modification methylase
LEETPEAYVQKMVEVFTEVKRVLKKEGTLFLNLGDSYAGSNKGIMADGSIAGGAKQNTHKGTVLGKMSKTPTFEGIKPKDLIGIPWMVAFALRQPFYTCRGCGNKSHAIQWGKFPNGRLICPVCELSKGHDIENGFYLRQDLIWSKPNPMPESVTDRCTKAHEYIFLLSKSGKYYYDHEAIKQPIADASIARLSQDIENQKGSDRVPGKTNGNMKAVSGDRKYVDQSVIGKKLSTHSGYFYPDGSIVGDGKANKRSVWTVTTKPFSEAHFATFPEDLIVDCIKAGCPENGVVLDPFMGAGTTALVASKLNRNFIGFELNPQYIQIAKNRLQNELGMFNQYNEAV